MPDLKTAIARFGTEAKASYWLAEYTTELLNVLHVLTLLVEMEPDQAKLMEAICDGPTLGFPTLD